MAKASVRRSSVDRPKSSIISDRGLVLVVYILYLVGFMNGLTAIIGAIIAYLQRDQGDPVVQSHFQFQFRTFLIGLLYVGIAAATLHVGLGFLILLWWLVWTLTRCIKGLLALNAGAPIANPNSWLFGEAQLS